MITGPLNSTPEGSVSNGLPYPFLNDMHLQDRIAFYATTIITGLLFYFAGWIVMKVKSHFFKLKDSLRHS